MKNMTENPYRATNVPSPDPTRPGHVWRLAAGIAWALVAFLLVDSAFSLSDQLARHRHGPEFRPSRCPTLYIGVQELLVGVSPRAAALVPATVLFFRISSFFTAIGIAAGALVRVASRGRWRIRTSQLVWLLMLSFVLGAIGTGITLLLAARESGRFDFFAAPQNAGLSQ